MIKAGELKACPYCGCVPTLDGMLKMIGGGVRVTAKKEDYNFYNITCCSSMNGYEHEVKSRWNNRINQA